VNLLYARQLLHNREESYRRILLREFFEKDVHADSITVGHDQKARISCKRFHGTIYIPVLTDMMAQHRWTDAFPASAVLGLVNPPKASLILKHETNVFAC